MKDITDSGRRDGVRHDKYEMFSQRNDSQTLGQSCNGRFTTIYFFKNFIDNLVPDKLLGILDV